MTLGDVIRSSREEAGISREVFAKNLGVSTKTLYRWESGEREPKMDRIRDIASLVHVSFRDFMTKATNPTLPRMRRPGKRKKEVPA
jgi:transcriptional regulator with XRE-family HTH domain